MLKGRISIGELENLPNIIFLSRHRLNDITNSYNSILKNTIDYLNYKVEQENAEKRQTKEYTENIKNYDDAYINNKEEIAKIVGEINKFFNKKETDDEKKMIIKRQHKLIYLYLIILNHIIICAL